MFEFMKGKVHSSLPGSVVLEVAGIGYRVAVPTSSTQKLKVGAEATLLLHHTINADQGEERLFGFLTNRERELFKALITVKGIGPTTAINILCVVDPPELIQLIATSDVGGLKKFKGVGPKSAERIVTELRDKVAPWAAGAVASSGGKVEAPESESARDAVSALVALGYPQNKSEAAVGKAVKKTSANASTEDLVRAALQAV
ncbi:MAG: Holliday junction branch migration protein RuvA [Planctomycetota bacterium]|jgi:Holliday junction DNA helicase RuvA